MTPVRFSGLCFGGPLNEEFAVAASDRLLAVVPPPPTQWVAGTDLKPATDMVLRQVLYSWQRVAYGDDVWGCWIADGFPLHRITDSLNAIAGLCVLSVPAIPQP